MFGLSAIGYVCGEPGAGKTYRRCAVFLADEFLPNYVGRVWTNYPINIPAMAAYVAKKTGRPAQEYADRIKIIPRETLIEWRQGKSGPWEFFHGVDVTGDYLAIDEIHKFISKRQRTGTLKDHVANWEEFLGEVRHRQFVGMEVLTQDPSKVHACIEAHAGMRLLIQKDETRFDPLLNLPMKAWYELWACWVTRRYEPLNWQVMQSRVMGKWVSVHWSRFGFNTDYFALYDSYSIEDQRGKVKAEPVFEFQRRSRLGLTWWFLTRNPSRLLVVLILAALFTSLLTGHAAKAFVWATSHVIGGVASRGTPQTANASANPTPSTSSSSAPTASPVDRPAGSAVPPVDMVPRTELEALQARLQVTESKCADLERRLGEASSVLMISGDQVTFRDGYTVAVGETIQFGEFNGRHIKRIEFKQRAVVLDDDRVLRMGGGLFGSSIRVGDAGPRDGGDLPSPPDVPAPPGR